MKACKHEFSCKVGVAIFDDKPGNGSVDISGHCVHCGAPLIFYGPRGASAPYPVASVSRTELRAPVTFGYAPKFSPGPEVLINGSELREPHKH